MDIFKVSYQMKKCFIKTLEVVKQNLEMKIYIKLKYTIGGVFKR